MSSDCKKISRKFRGALPKEATAAAEAKWKGPSSNTAANWLPLNFHNYETGLAWVNLRYLITLAL